MSAEELTLEEARAQGLLGGAAKPRKAARARGQAAGPNPGPSRQEHLGRAARRGWVVLESRDCETYRLGTLDGRWSPWLPYDELTARYGGPRATE